MQKKIWALLGATVMAAGMAFVVPAAMSETPQPKDVKVCPMMGSAVQGEGAGNQVVGEYKVYFCCGGCKKAFNKLSEEEQVKRVAEAVKKAEAAQKQKEEK